MNGKVAWRELLTPVPQELAPWQKVCLDLVLCILRQLDYSLQLTAKEDGVRARGLAGQGNRFIKSLPMRRMVDQVALTRMARQDHVVCKLVQLIAKAVGVNA